MLFEHGAVAPVRWLVVLIMAALIAGGVGTQLMPAEATEKQKECKAKDLDKDGEIEEGETQDCGGDEYGIGGDDGADLPHAEEDANSHQWVDNGYALHWSKPSSDERKIIIRDSVADSSSYDTKLGYVLGDWGASSKFKFTRQSAETDATTRLNCPMPDYYGRVRVCNHADYTFSYAGYANVRYNDQGHIQRGRVRVKNAVADASQRALLCQEVGHTLGLWHRSTTASCMHQNADNAYRSPDQHDYDQLVNQTHSHGSESDTGGALSDLDTGGGVLDGCVSFLCFESGSHGRSHDHDPTGYAVTVDSVRRLSGGGFVIGYGFSLSGATGE